MFTHFTNAEGVIGITGIPDEAFTIGDARLVLWLRFGKGVNEFRAQGPGDIFVTDYPPNTPDFLLAAIGIFDDKRDFAIQFSGENAASFGYIVRSTGAPHIYVLPAGAEFGPGTLTRRH